MGSLLRLVAAADGPGVWRGRVIRPIRYSVPDRDGSFRGASRYGYSDRVLPAINTILVPDLRITLLESLSGFYTSTVTSRVLPRFPPTFFICTHALYLISAYKSVLIVIVKCAIRVCGSFTRVVNQQPRVLNRHWNKRKQIVSLTPKASPPRLVTQLPAPMRPRTASSIASKLS